jgi:uncharacterized protein YbbK (DUF523 family)
MNYAEFLSIFVDIILLSGWVTTVKEMILVSACLLGLRCRYNECNNTDQLVLDLREKYILIPVCPEQLGGMQTPRPPSFFIKGDGLQTLEGIDNLINDRNENVSSHFRKGSEEALKICRLFNIKTAILKENSPSCGTHQIYLKEKLTKGMGVTATILKFNGIRVMSENDIRRLYERKN